MVQNQRAGDLLHQLRDARPVPVAPDLTQRWLGLLGLAVAVGIAYFLAARLGLALLTKADGVAVFWPASGVAAGILIALGPAARLPVIAGAAGATIAANLLGDRNLSSALVFALCNAAEAVLAAAIVERYFGSGFSLGRLSHVLGLLAAAIAATAVSGIGGVLGFKLFHSAEAPVLTIWQHWFASDALGILTVAPLLIGLASVASDPPPRREFVEGFLALAGARRDERACRSASIAVLGDHDAGHSAIPAVAVACGPLSAGLRLGGRVHRRPDNRRDDDLRHWSFRRPRRSGRRPHPGRSVRHSRGVALRTRPCRAVRRATSARGRADGERRPIAGGVDGGSGDGLRLGSGHWLVAAKRQRGADPGI